VRTWQRKHDFKELFDCLKGTDYDGWVVIVEKFYLGEPVDEKTLVPMRDITPENYQDYF
jgi:hypothetical protein